MSTILPGSWALGTVGRAERSCFDLARHGYGKVGGATNRSVGAGTEGRCCSWIGNTHGQGVVNSSIYQDMEAFCIIPSGSIAIWVLTDNVFTC